ncbi:aminopeptidase P family protein [Bacillus sp. EB106-08-02-XG196]|nr:aminopeptidase P family protein [Bacillus sp. EB106-08-02-XG196]
MIISMQKQEREQRLSKVRELMENKGYKAMIFAASSYLGKKGSLRYLFDNHLYHRYGYGVVFEDKQYQILPSGLHYGTDPRSPDVIFPEDHEVMEMVRKLKENNITNGVVGAVGLNSTMKVEDYLYLKKELPEVEWEDASVEFDVIRSIKSEEEIQGIIETNRIIEAGFDSIIKNIKVGMTEEEAVAPAYQTVHAMGAKDDLFLTLSSEQPGAVVPCFLPPRNKVIKENDYLIVSLEITGPTGHWVEFSRMFCFGERDAETEALASVVAEGIGYAEENMKPGIRLSDIQAGLDRIANEYGYECGHLSGHGIGMDVIERPFVARKTNTKFVGVEVSNEDDDALLYLKEGMVISYHPQIIKPGREKSAYMSDVFIIRENGAERLSNRNHEVIFIDGK